MKKILTLVLAFFMLISLAACAGNNSGNSGNSGNNTPANNTPGNQESGNQSGDNNNGQSSNPEPAKLSGKITVFDLDDRNASVLKGVSINGNRVGSKDDINGKEKSLTDVRNIFEVEEWVEFYPDTDAQYYLRVWVLKHRDDQDYYKTCTFSDLMPGFAAFCDLHYPEDAEEPETYAWGSFYLQQDDNQPGYYDFVFTYEGKAIGVLLTRFYAPDELNGIYGNDLISLMRE